ncbi:helix-turn-helix domain-containing protein [Castellaniella sp.]|uniref:transcriptional regulator n=1 Tax=Castellaniella sp. TaxID=1955812 RepID=UPI002AFF92BB|nr:helix-turn-helix domain-containing protein [Castellaniella sp.]
MNLKKYLRRRGAAAQLAKALRVSPVLVSQWRAGTRQVPAARCPSIERETGGRVRCEDLRPDVDWNYLRTSGDFEEVA